MSTRRQRKPILNLCQYVILIRANVTSATDIGDWEMLHEGPWDDYEQCLQFARNEVGPAWAIACVQLTEEVDTARRTGAARSF